MGGNRDDDEHLRTIAVLRPIPDADQARILLVDDVYTSGATMRGCARVLKAAGVKPENITLFTVARTM